MDRCRASSLSEIGRSMPIGPGEAIGGAKVANLNARSGRQGLTIVVNPSSGQPLTKFRWGHLDG
jgi:hypothetical protein